MDETTVEDRIFDAIKRNLAEVMPDVDSATVSIDQSLRDLGCNSLDRMDIVSMTVEDLRIDVPVWAFKDVADIRGLIDVLKQRL